MDVGAFILALAGGLLIVCLLLLGALMRLRRRIRRHRALIDQLPQTAVISFNRELIVTFAAGPALGGGGWGADELEGKSILEMFAPAQANTLRPKFDAALRGEKRSFEYRAPFSGREYSMRVVPFADAAGNVETGLFMARDVTETTQVEGEFASRAADVGAVSQATRALARSLDPAAARKAVCAGASEVAQAPVAVLFEPGQTSPSLVPQASVGAELDGFEVAIDGESGAALAFSRAEEVFVSLGSATEADERFMRRTRSEAVLWHPVVRDRAAIGVLAVAWRDETAGVSLRLSAMLDVLAAEAAVAIGRADLLGQLEYMARTDSLTGLPNRRYWEQELPRELARARRDENPLCVAMLDLDHFKAFNDRRGHQAGDQLLTEAAAAWRLALRPYDILARFGGEEFSVILPGCATPDAVRLIERLRFVTPSGESCSAGIAEWDGDEHADALVGRADAALYRAKRAGRDQSVTARS